MRQHHQTSGEDQRKLTSSNTHFNNSSCLLNRSTFTSSSSLFKKIQSASWKTGNTVQPYLTANGGETHRKQTAPIKQKHVSTRFQEQKGVRGWVRMLWCLLKENRPIPTRLTGICLFISEDMATSSELTNESLNIISSYCPNDFCYSDVRV